VPGAQGVTAVSIRAEPNMFQAEGRKDGRILGSHVHRVVWRKIVNKRLSRSK
jgi:hypothetical protein